MPIVEPEIPWNLVMGWRRAAYMSRATRAWIDTVSHLLRKWIGQVKTRKEHGSKTHLNKALLNLKTKRDGNDKSS
jgi:hypothetical protein